jgi:hypothetical protein
VGEPNETLVVNLSRPVAAAIADAQATVTIVNDDVTIQPGPSTFLAVTDVTVKEANSGSTPATFTLSRSGDTTGSSSVRYATTDGGTATADSDFVAVAVTTVSFGPDETTKSVTVSVTGDVALEPDETFFVKLSSPSGATISDDEGKGIITNDDILPNLSVTDVAVVEGSASTVDATFTIIRSGDVSRSSSLRYGTAAGSASAGTDYVEVSSGTATFAPGETVKTVAVGVRGDTTPEADETFVLKLSSPVDATLSDDSGTATILNDDVLPTFAVNDVTLFETNAQTTAILSVTRAGDASGTSSVAYAMAGVTASAGSDFVAISGRLTFAPGERIKIVTVTVVGDTVAEPNEVLSLTLSAPTGATIGDDQGSATILNDD